MTCWCRPAADSYRPQILTAMDSVSKTAASPRHQLDVTQIDEAWAEVTSWRLHQLLEAGFAPGLAAQTADVPGVDVHALLELIDHGCSPELAVRIVGVPMDGAP